MYQAIYKALKVVKNDKKSLISFLFASAIPQILNFLIFSKLSKGLIVETFATYNYLFYLINFGAVFIFFGQQDTVIRFFLTESKVIAFNRLFKVLSNIFVINLFFSLVLYYIFNSEISKVGDYKDFFKVYFLLFFVIFFICLDSINRQILIIENKAKEFILISLFSYVSYFFIINFAILEEINYIIYFSPGIPSVLFGIGTFLIFYKKIRFYFENLEIRKFSFFYLEMFNKTTIFSFLSIVSIYVANVIIIYILKSSGSSSLVAEFATFQQIFTIVLFVPNINQKLIMREISKINFEFDSIGVRNILKYNIKFVLIQTFFFSILVFIINKEFNFYPYVDDIGYLLIFINLIVHTFSLVPSSLWLIYNKLELGFYLNFIFIFIIFLFVSILIFFSVLTYHNLLFVYIIGYSILAYFTSLFKSKLL
jgi:hypothetical protein